jgi:hydrogenase maturation factor
VVVGGVGPKKIVAAEYIEMTTLFTTFVIVFVGLARSIISKKKDLSVVLLLLLLLLLL